MSACSFTDNPCDAPTTGSFLYAPSVGHPHAFRDNTTSAPHYPINIDIYKSPLFLTDRKRRYPLLNRRSQSFKWRTDGNEQGSRSGKTKHKEINNNATNNIEQQCGCIRKLLPRQESKSPPDEYQASGQRKADCQSQRRSWHSLGGDEAKRGGQPIVRSEEQCAERHLIRRGAGWRARDRWPDRRPYGGTQRYGHTGSDEKLAGCAVLQQRVCGPAETTARCLGPDLQWSQSVRGFRDWFRRKSHRDTSRVPREHLGRQHHRDIHHIQWSQGPQVPRTRSVQIAQCYPPDDRCKSRPDRSALLSAITSRVVRSTRPVSPSQRNVFGLFAASDGSTISLGATGLSMGVFEQALSNVAYLRAQTGGGMSRLTFAADSISSMETNLRSAIGRIEDVDIAAESANLAKYSILTQASAAMVAQANSTSDIALMLLR